MERNGLPTVMWKGHEISRLILGHNPMKGHSHMFPELDTGMRAWFEDIENGTDLLQRCAKEGINTVQAGRGRPFEILTEAANQGISLKWIATLYNDPDGHFDQNHRYGPNMTAEEEYRSFGNVKAARIGCQHFGESTDRAHFAGEMSRVEDTIRWLREQDQDQLIGVCTHLPEVVEYLDGADWPIDFLQTSLHTVYAHREKQCIARGDERFRESDIEPMIRVISHTRYPCIVFKVLAGGWKCSDPQVIRDALSSVFSRIKATDVVCIGMWQKYSDQVAQNAEHVREVLAGQQPAVAAKC